MNDLSQEIKAYESMRPVLEQHHNGKWVVVHDSQLVDAFDTLDLAASEAVRRFGRGPYLIRRVGAPPVVLPASAMFRPANAAD